MVTLTNKTNIDGDGHYHYEFAGLSTDTKPTSYLSKPIEINSLFLELDTGTFFYFDGLAWQTMGA